MVLGGFPILAAIECSVFGDMLAHEVGSLDEVIAQVAVAGLGHAAVFSLKVSGIGTRPPQASQLGDGIFGIAEVSGTIAFASFVPLLRLQETLDSADFGTVSTGEDRTHTGNGRQFHDGGVRLDFGGDPILDQGNLGLKETDVFQGEVQDAVHRQGQSIGQREALSSYLVERAGVVEGVGEMMSAHLVQGLGQIFHRNGS
mgnify:CR=1 FL=1